MVISGLLLHTPTSHIRVVAPSAARLLRPPTPPDPSGRWGEAPKPLLDPKRLKPRESRSHPGRPALVQLGQVVQVGGLLDHKLHLEGEDTQTYDMSYSTS